MCFLTATQEVTEIILYSFSIISVQSHFISFSLVCLGPIIALQWVLTTTAKAGNMGRRVAATRLKSQRLPLWNSATWEWEPSGVERRTSSQQVVYLSANFLGLPLGFCMCLFVIPHYLYPSSLMHSTESQLRFACWKKLRHVVCDIFLGKQQN